MDPKTATKLDEIDLLKRINWQLRKQLLDKEADEFAAAMLAKYGNPGEHMEVNADTGAIIRTKREEPPTP